MLIRGLDPESAGLERPSAARMLVAGSTASRRFSTLLLSLFAAVAVLPDAGRRLRRRVAARGAVTREIGVRIAMGASGGDVMSLMLGARSRMAVAGVAAGRWRPGLAAPALGGMVYGIAPRDPATLIGVAAAARWPPPALAAYVPARRILRLDVVHALPG